MDSAEFHAASLTFRYRIPPQKVTSYSHIAKLISMPRYSRHVGQALKFLSPEVTPPVPWHRVISAAGTISSRGPGTTGAQHQRDALEAEGIEVTDGRTGDFRVNLASWGWFPAPGTVSIADNGAAAEQVDGTSNQ
ncbi:DNA binding methylated-DNA-cysteine S-methyltransferase [Imleria badia]|nr:DNA binding methylated-DNA-cysteine S-methyltransferase [Imleria badia]